MMKNIASKSNLALMDIAQHITNLVHDPNDNEHCIGVTEVFFDGMRKIWSTESNCPLKKTYYFLANCNSIYSVSFFLGEEALIDFSDDDGLYGSKHLAKAWSSTTTINSKSYFNFRTELDRIHLFVLLDLLGSASPKFKSFSVC